MPNPALFDALPAHRLRSALRAFAQGLRAGQVPLQAPQAALRTQSRGRGHFHLAPELFLQLGGWTQFDFPDESRRLVAGQALIIPPGLRHAERVGPDDQSGAFSNVVIFSDGLRLSCHTAVEAAPATPGIEHLEGLRHPQARRIQDWLLQAWESMQHEEAVARQQAWALLEAALAGMLLALEGQGDHPGETEPSLVARCRVLVQNQLGEQGLGVGSLAKACGCTPDHLSAVFKKTTGEALLTHMERLRMDRAQRLLADGELSVKEVAWACGFASAGYFIKVFKRHQGLTPLAWQARQQAAPAWAAPSATAGSPGVAGTALVARA